MRTATGRTHHVRIGAVTPGRSFRIDARPIPASTFRFDCEIMPMTNGARISQRVSFGGLGVVLGPMMGRGVAASFPAILEALKAKAEAAEGAGGLPAGGGSGRASDR